MGGGDLNTKKSWHPKTIKNQEKVWKAEQVQAQEDKKMSDLRKEIDQERFHEAIVQHGQTSGVLADKPNRKMDWMYKEPSHNVDREQYLLGKAIDKTFEKMAAEEQQNSQSAPKNHVEHECIPFSIRNLKSDVPPVESQVDLARKLLEDPLVAIRKREVESRTQLLQNPVKLKQLSMLLKADQMERLKRKEMKKSKKSKKHKDKLEDKIFEKLKKLGGDQLDDIKSLLSDKSKKKKKKKSKHSSTSDSESDSDSESNVKSTRKHKKRKKSSDREDKQAKEESSHSKNRKRSGKYSEDEDDAKQSKSKRYKLSDDRRKRYDDSDIERKPSGSYDKNYGLVKADGSKMSITNKSHKPIIDSKSKPQTKEAEPRFRKKLTEEEMEEKRREMMQDAVKRDREREHNVKYYKSQDKKEELKNKNHEFQNDFVEKHLRTAVVNSSVESRIKSKINNIQRSYGNMDKNFARR